MYPVYILHNHKMRFFFLISKIKSKRRWMDSSICQVHITAQRGITSSDLKCSDLTVHPFETYPNNKGNCKEVSAAINYLPVSENTMAMYF